MKKLLLVLLITAMGMFEGHSQALVQTYTDRCTGQVSVFTVPLNGQTVVAFYNRSKTFTAQQFTNGELQAWLEETYAWWQALSPCSTGNANSQTTQQTTTNATTNATNAAANATSGATQNTGATTTASTGATGAATTGNTNNTNSNTNTNGTSSGNTTSSNSSSAPDNSTSNTSNDSSSSSSGNTSTDSTSGSGNDQSNNSSNESSSNTDGDTQGEGESGSNENNEGNDTSSDQEENSTDSESQESESESEEVEETKEESNEEESNESSEEESEEESTEEESESNEDEESEEEDSKEESNNEDEEEDDKKKKKKRSLAPPIISANVVTMQMVDGMLTNAASFGYSQSSLTGIDTYSANAMVWSNLKQFSLNLSRSRVVFNWDRPIKNIILDEETLEPYNFGTTYGQGSIMKISSISGGYMKMFSTHIATVGISDVFMGQKDNTWKGFVGGWAITGMGVFLEGGNVVTTAALTAFGTKPFNFKKLPRVTISPMLAYSMSPITYDFNLNEVILSKHGTWIVGSNFDFNLTQRFRANLGGTLIGSTIPNMPLSYALTIGSKFQF
jgi:hypothetical protein